MSDKNECIKFYYVLCDGGGLCSSFRFSTFEGAYKEAIRLAKTTGKNYFVMKTMIRVVPTQNIVVEDARP